MIPAWLLTTAEHCPESRALFELDPINATGGLRHLWRDAFHLGVQAMTDPTNAQRYLQSHRAVLAALQPKVAMAVTEAIANHFEEVRKGVIPTIHNFAIGIDMDMDGIAPAQREPSIGARLDCSWQEHAREGGTTAVVLTHELAEAEYVVGTAFWPDLGALAAGVAWAAKNDADRLRIGRCTHRLGKPVSYLWSQPMGDRDMQLILARTRRALTTSRVANEGAHCKTCPALRACAAWQLPMMHGAHDALKPLQKHGERINKQNVERVRRVAYAMKTAAELAELQIKMFEETEGAA